MNCTADKLAVDAAKYFKEEVLDIMPDIPAEQLSDMVDSYVYYQQADLTRNQAHDAVQETFGRKQRTLPVRPSRRGY